MNPVKTYYELGWLDAMDKNRKRRRNVIRTYQLAYADGWYDAKAGRKHRYADKED